MSKPLVSVLIPVYNRVDFVQKAIESALMQKIDKFPIEIVVVDNASTDGTWNVLQLLGQSDSRIRVFRNKENIGPVRNWVQCLEHANGVYGKFLFSDDLLLPSYFESTMAYIIKEDVGLVFSAVKIGGAELDSRTEYLWKDDKGVYSSEKLIESILFSRKVPFSPGAAIFRISDLKSSLLSTIDTKVDVGFLAHGAGPDVLLYLMIAKNYKNIAYVNEPLVFFREHEGAISIEKGEVVQKAYVMAKEWFVRNYLNESTRQMFLAYEWLRSCFRKQKIITRVEFAKSLGFSNGVKLSGVISALIYQIKMRVFNV